MFFGETLNGVAHKLNTLNSKVVKIISFEDHKFELAYLSNMSRYLKFLQNKILLSFYPKVSSVFSVSQNIKNKNIVKQISKFINLIQENFVAKFVFKFKFKVL